LLSTPVSSISLVVSQSCVVRRERESAVEGEESSKLCVGDLFSLWCFNLGVSFHSRRYVVRRPPFSRRRLLLLTCEAKPIISWAEGGSESKGVLP